MLYPAEDALSMGSTSIRFYMSCNSMDLLDFLIKLRYPVSAMDVLSLLFEGSNLLYSAQDALSTCSSCPRRTACLPCVTSSFW